MPIFLTTTDVASKLNRHDTPHLFRNQLISLNITTAIFQQNYFYNFSKAPVFL